MQRIRCEEPQLLLAIYQTERKILRKKKRERNQLEYLLPFFEKKSKMRTNMTCSLFTLFLRKDFSEKKSFTVILVDQLGSERAERNCL